MDIEKSRRGFQLKYLRISTFFFMSSTAMQANVDYTPLNEVLSGYQDNKLGTYSVKKLTII